MDNGTKYFLVSTMIYNKLIFRVLLYNNLLITYQIIIQKFHDYLKYIVDTILSKLRDDSLML